MEQNTQPTGASKESLWYLDNYILLKDYYDRTISRIAARCIRMGNIAMEEYKYYGYILDVLEEISETGDYILEHKELYPYVEKKIAGGMESFKKTLAEYQLELKNNSSPDMIKEDAHEVEKMKEVLGEIDKTVDPTALPAAFLSECRATASDRFQSPPQKQCSRVTNRLRSPFRRHPIRRCSRPDHSLRPPYRTKSKKSSK